MPDTGDCFALLAMTRIGGFGHFSEADAEDLSVGFLNKRRSNAQYGRQRTADSVEKLGYKMDDSLALNYGDDWVVSVIHGLRGFCSGLVVFERI